MSSKTDKFISLVSPHAVTDMKEKKILASVTIAQAILESSWGESELAKNANNYFGIKANSSWRGKKYIVKTSEYDSKGNKYYIDAPFRKYDSILESISDHSQFLLDNSRYSAIPNDTDYKSVCNKLQKAGYATDPSYANLLINLIDKYELYKFDKMVTNNTASTTNTDVLYRVRKTWDDAKSQIGAYKNLDNAKKIANEKGYSVFDSNGNKIYPKDNTIYRVRKTWVDAKSQIGAYKNLDNAKKIADEKGYYVFDDDGNKVYPL